MAVGLSEVQPILLGDVEDLPLADRGGCLIVLETVGKLSDRDEPTLSLGERCTVGLEDSADYI